MEAIRTLIHSERLAPILELTEGLRNRMVEVIVLASSDQTDSRKTKTDEPIQMGCLKEYADSALRNQEKNAWKNAVAQKYTDSSILNEQ